LNLFGTYQHCSKRAGTFIHCTVTMVSPLMGSHHIKKRVNLAKTALSTLIQQTLNQTQKHVPNYWAICAMTQGSHAFGTALFFTRKATSGGY